MQSNYHEVVHQMGDFGIQLRPQDLPLQIDRPRKRTCGKGGKYWYRLYEFRPRAGGAYIVGAYGSYASGEWQKVEVDWRPLSEAERERFRAERAAAEAKAREEREHEAQLAAMSAAQLWRTASREGQSAYLQRKGVEPEACRYLRDGSIVVPLLRYDLPREQALRALQRIYPGPRFDRRTKEPLPQKTFTKGFLKDGCCLRLGEVVEGSVLLVCEGYATGLSLRMAIERRHPVFIALDAHNLRHVVEILRRLYPDHPLLICADDDHRRRHPVTGELENLGRLAAWKVARQVDACYVTYPVFGATRGEDDTDFNDLHARDGLPAVAEQLRLVLEALR